MILKLNQSKLSYFDENKQKDNSENYTFISDIDMFLNIAVIEIKIIFKNSISILFENSNFSTFSEKLICRTKKSS